MSTYDHWLTRRELFRRAGLGFGMLGLAGLLADEGLLAPADGAVSATNPLAPKRPHFDTKAKTVIWLFMNGGPSQVDTWDYKPELEKRDGQELTGFDKNTGFFTRPGRADDEVAVQVRPARPVREPGSPRSSRNMAQHVDKMAFIHSCWTESNNHSPALFMINTGMTRMGFPCVGSWVTYGLGSESQNLPAFVVMSDPLGRGLPKGYAQNWGAGFLPSIYQGTWLQAAAASRSTTSYRPAT